MALNVLEPALGAVSKAELNQPLDSVPGQRLLEGFNEAVPGQDSDWRPTLVAQEDFGRGMVGGLRSASRRLPDRCQHQAGLRYALRIVVAHTRIV